jgi:para-aminobenzoate synthetase/4-amino-4-deoxychorismate lyase
MAFCLSVAIRTLTLGGERHGQRPLRLGIGAGIVQDSVAADEHDECRLKACFLTGLDPGFELFETLLHLPQQGVQHVDLHLARLALSHGGRLTLSHAPLAPLAVHKTTPRAQYDAGVQAAERAGAFDSLFFNSDGRLVEGGRSSVFVQIDGRWHTPPLVVCNALRGVLPARLRQASAVGAT